MKLFYRKLGDGHPVIVLHGIFGISDNWITIGRRLAEKFAVYLVDQRNHGQSPHSPTFNYPAMVDDLYEFIEEHELEDPVLIGHSMGGKVAMNFAMDYPALVNKLILVDMSPRQYKPRPIHSTMISAMMSVNFDVSNTRKDVEDHLALTIGYPGIRMFLMKNLQRVGKNRFEWRINLEAITNNLNEIFKGVDQRKTFEGPTLFVRGGKSDYVQDKDFELIKKLFPNSEIETLEEASHWLHADAPEKLCAIFSEYLEKECVYRRKG